MSQPSTGYTYCCRWRLRLARTRWSILSYCNHVTAQEHSRPRWSQSTPFILCIHGSKMTTRSTCLPCSLTQCTRVLAGQAWQTDSRVCSPCSSQVRVLMSPTEFTFLNLAVTSKRLLDCVVPGIHLPKPENSSCLLSVRQGPLPIPSHASQLKSKSRKSESDS